jgi:hypothetical protein
MLGRITGYQEGYQVIKLVIREPRAGLTLLFGRKTLPENADLPNIPYDLLQLSTVRTVRVYRRTTDNGTR